MEYILTSEEMKKYDYNTIQRIGIPSMVLMEKAAMAVVEELSGFNLSKVLVACGSGNNGGDGIAIARILHLQGYKATILFLGSLESSTKETRQQLEIAKKLNIPIINQADLSGYSLILDAIFGVGLSREIEGSYAEVIKDINSSGKPVLAVDIPSGISADTGKVLGLAVKADKTVAIAFKKRGHLLFPGAAYAGELVVKDIGINEASFFGEEPSAHSYREEDLTLRPERQTYSNKGTYGKVLVIGGSLTMNGAIYLSAKSAYRMGAGLVYIYTLENNREIMQTLLPEAVLESYDMDQSDHTGLMDLIDKVDVAVIGPGMSVSKHTKNLLEIVIKYAKIPLILDADALNIISETPGLLKNHIQPLIVTPHLGEMARIRGKEVSEIRDNLIGEAEDYARQEGLICVLKDARTIVAGGQGPTYINQSGCNAMATGGSGDVLTGVIAGLVAQGADLERSAKLAVYIHGLAGQEAAKRLGNYAVMASDIVESLGRSQPKYEIGCGKRHEFKIYAKYQFEYS